MTASRRDLLTWTARIAAGSALGSFARGGSLDPFTRGGSFARRVPLGSFARGLPPVTRTPARRATVSEITDTVHWIVTTPRDSALRRGARELRAGLAPTDLLGALLVAAARKIHPDLPQFNHAALVVSSIDELARDASPEERAADVLWCLDNFKASQEQQSGAKAWTWTPLDAQRVPTADHARAALVDALEKWDAEAADVALVGFVRSAPLEVVYELVWEYGMRCRANIGHKAIYAAQSRRALPLAGSACAEEVLRSVVRTYFLHGQTADAAAFEKSRAIVARDGAYGESRSGTRAAMKPAADLGAARELLVELRRADADDLPAIAAKLARDGADPSTLWDAILIAASEISVARPDVAMLHAFTSTNALHYMSLHAPSERLATIALLQASAWVSLFRRSLDKASTDAAAFRIDELAPLETKGTAETTGAADANDASVLTGPRMEIARRAATAGNNAARAEAFRTAALTLVRTKADDVHEFKLAAAALEESRQAGSWARSSILAALAVHLPDPARAESEPHERIREAIATAH